jgi:hypothetical protein
VVATCFTLQPPILEDRSVLIARCVLPKAAASVLATTAPTKILDVLTFFAEGYCTALTCEVRRNDVTSVETFSQCDGITVADGT